MLTGVLCALMTDLLRLLFCAFQAAPDSARPRAPKSGEHIIAQTGTDCILSGEGNKIHTPENKAHTFSDPAQKFVTFYHFLVFFISSFFRHRRRSMQSEARAASPRPYPQAAAGFLAGTATALIAAAVCFVCANGNMRPYMALAMAAGAALYHATLGRLLRSARRHFLRLSGILFQRIAANAAIRRIFR